MSAYDAPSGKGKDRFVARVSASADDMATLEQELQETRDRLQTTIEEYETALERLKSSNEELMSVNEELVAAEEQQRLLVAELNHRVRNMLQVVIGMAGQTLHRSTSLEQFEKAFLGRMQALARAYELLSREGWRSVPIAELLHTQLGPFTGDTRRYKAEGDNVVLVANAALSIGLVIYELATNATKYGALSVPGGHVDVSWKLVATNGERHELVLRWSEHDGPPVHPPTRHGFGSELVQRQLRYELNGQSSVDYAETGLQVTLTIPASDVIQLADLPAS